MVQQTPSIDSPSVYEEPEQAWQQSNNGGGWGTGAWSPLGVLFTTEKFREGCSDLTPHRAHGEEGLLLGTLWKCLAQPNLPPGGNDSGLPGQESPWAAGSTARLTFRKTGGLGPDHVGHLKSYASQV